VNLNLEASQHFDDNPMRRQAKSSSENASKTTNSSSGSGTSSVLERAPHHPQNSPNAASHACGPSRSLTSQTQQYAPGNNSTTTAKLLTIFSNDDTFDDVVAVDGNEEEDDITYCLRCAGGFLHVGQFISNGKWKARSSLLR
jgi:hypothetical protein